MTTRKGGWRWVDGKRYARVRVTANSRPSIPLSACATDEEATERAAIIAAIANKLVKGGRPDRVKDICEVLGAAKGEKQIEAVKRAAERLLTMAAVAPKAITLKAFAERWTNGELHRQYPDHVRKKQSAGDVGKLKKYIYPHVATVPLVAFGLEEAELVMSHVPASASRATRRHVAQVMNRILNMAVYPAKLIKANPLPKGFLPKLGADKARPYLYPADDLRLMGCTDIPVERRLLWGMLAREGMRSGELLGGVEAGVTADPIVWGNLNLSLGAIDLDKNKTDDPRTWALDKGVVAALVAWRKLSPKSKTGDAVFPTRIVRLADQFRADLKTAKVDRPELFERNATRARVKAHHLRATFVTLALANGKTETWVADRTGHKSSSMINRYRRLARTAAELGVGALAPLDGAIPELAAKGGAKAAPAVGGSDMGQTGAESALPKSAG
jgi:integrase